MEVPAVLSEDRKYRYILRRKVDSLADGSCLFVMLNPSTADELLDDPTIRRCIGYARQWGYGMLEVVNLFALRATDPKELELNFDPMGELNDAYIEGAAERASLIVCAWGERGKYRNRAALVRELLAHHDLYALAINKSGQPKHPLYCPKNAELVKL